LANETQEFQGQIIGTTAENKTKKILVEKDGSVVVKNINNNIFILDKGITSNDGPQDTLVDSTKNFGKNFIGKTVRLAVGDIIFYRTILAASGGNLVIEPLQTESTIIVPSGILYEIINYGSNIEQTDGADAANKSALVAGKTSAGKGVPIQVDNDGKIQVGGITVESLTATIVSIDQTTPGVTNKVVAELSGSNVEIGGVNFAVSGGDTLRNTAANKPTAADAHATIPFCHYYSIDIGKLEVTDGTNWMVI